MSHSKEYIAEAMELALALARHAASIGEVPVGCVIVNPRGIVGTGYNGKERDQCGTRHAEVIAIEKASHCLGRWRLDDCLLISTIEPCIMCAGAIIQARVPVIAYGARDDKFGAFGSLYSMHKDARITHRMEVIEGLEAETCRDELRNFFRQRRGLHKLKT